MEQSMPCASVCIVLFIVIFTFILASDHTVSIKIKRTSNLVFSHIPLPEFIWSADWFCACTMYIFINILFTTEIPQGPYKAHWVTEGNVMSYSKDIACIDVKRRSRWGWKWWSQWSCCFRHDPPLLYNVEADPQELYRLTPGTFSDYDQVIITTSPFAFDLVIIIIISVTTDYDDDGGASWIFGSGRRDSVGGIGDQGERAGGDALLQVSVLSWSQWWSE